MATQTELYEALAAAVEVMSTVPSLNVLYGLAVLEHCRTLVETKLSPITALPINMVLHCPNCGQQHIDKADEGWNDPPHRSHLCRGCGFVWRVADVPTRGVQATLTRGRDDSPATPRAAARAAYKARPSFFALPPAGPGDYWAVGASDSLSASNWHLGRTLDEAIDTALRAEATPS